MVEDGCVERREEHLALLGEGSREMGLGLPLERQGMAEASEFRGRKQQSPSNATA